MRPFSASLIVLLATPILTPAEEPLAKVLRDGDVSAKRQALAAFWRSPADEKHHPALREALKDENKNVRQLAASALAWSGVTDKVVLNELIRGMAEPWKPSYRALPDDPMAAYEALVKAGEKAVPALVAVVEDKKHPARASAVWALGEIGKPAKAALPAIEAVIRDRDLPGLHHIIEAKYQIDGDAAFAIKHLVPLLDTEEGRNCDGANRVLARMGADAKDAVPALVAAMKKYKEGEICYDLVALAPHFRAQVVLALREVLDDPDLARTATHALREIGEADAEVDFAELVKNPEKYHGKVVRIEVTLKRFVAEENWAHLIKTDGGAVDVYGKGKPNVCDGDKVAITGTFTYLKNSFVPHSIVADKIEKREPKKP
jgi:HEAT repeat protein